MLIKSGLTYCVFLLGFIPSMLYCQNNHELKEVLIEAESLSKALTKQKEAGTATLSVSSKDLNNFGHRNAGDVIKRLPRVFVQGPPSFNRNIMMGGLDKDFQAVLIEGNRPGGGEDSRDFKLDRIPVEMIESIDVIYNPPVIYGADASIGLVNIKLKDVPDKPFVSSNLSFDFTSTKPGVNPNFNISLGSNFKKWSIIGSYNFNQLKRINIKYLSDTTYSGQDHEDVNVQINGLMTSIAYRVDSTKIFKLKSFFTHYNEHLYFYTDIKKRTEGDLATTADTAFDDKKRILHTHTLSFETKKKNYNWKHSLTISQHFDVKDRLRHQQKTDGLYVTLEDEDQKNAELIYASEFKTKMTYGQLTHAITAGIKGTGLWRTFDRMVYSKLYDYMFWDDITDGSYLLNEYRGSVYVSDELDWGKLWLMPALRFDIDNRSYTTIDDEGSFTYYSLNPSLHLKYETNKHVYFKGDIARQLARPPFNEQVPVDKIKHKKQIIERGNPDLLPSTAWNMGAGVETYFNKDSYVSIRGFYSILNNVIESQLVGVDDELGYQIIQSVNVDSGLVWGIDLDLNIKLLDTKINQLSYVGNISWLGSQVRDPGTYQLRQLNEQPNWMTNNTINYLNTILKMQVSLGINYIGERQIAETSSDGVAVNALVYDDYLQFDARIKYFFTTWGSVYLNVNNLFDQQMSSMQGAVHESEVLGRNWIIGMNLRF